MSALTTPAALEQAELRGLVRTDTVPRLTLRLAHPLYGEVRRSEIGQVRARRLRGLVATALSTEESPPRRCGPQCSPWTPTCGPIPDA